MRGREKKNEQTYRVLKAQSKHGGGGKESKERTENLTEAGEVAAGESLH